MGYSKSDSFRTVQLQNRHKNMSTRKNKTTKKASEAESFQKLARGYYRMSRETTGGTNKTQTDTRTETLTHLTPSLNTEYFTDTHTHTPLRGR